MRVFAVYWEPGWIGNANLGSSCAVSLDVNCANCGHVTHTRNMKDNLLVDSSGATRTSINMFSQDM